MAMPNVPEQLSDAWTRLYRAKEIYDAFVNEVPEFMYQYVKGMIKGWSPESESFVVQLPHPSARILKGRPRALIVDLVENLRGSHVFGQVARVYSRGKRRHGNGSKKAQIFV